MNDENSEPVIPSPAEQGQASHVAVPVKLLNMVTALIGSKIPWAEADGVMSQLKVSCIAINLKPVKIPPEQD